MAKGKYEKWLEPDGLLLLEGWARKGLTDEQIAHNMGIGYTTLKTWKTQFPTIRDALKKGKEVTVFEVENALYKSALGYSYTETRQEIDENGKKRVVKTTREVLPNVTAQIFFLKNKDPETWRDRHNVELAKAMDESVKEMESYFDEQKEKGNP